MTEGKVESTKVVPLVFDLRSLCDGVPHAHEQVLEAIPCLGDDVTVTETSAPIYLC
jgi:hypothetical protein